MSFKIDNIFAKGVINGMHLCKKNGTDIHETILEPI